MGKLTEQVFIIKTLTNCTNAEDWLDEIQNITISNCLCELEDLLFDGFYCEGENTLARIYKCINEYRKGLE